MVAPSSVAEFHADYDKHPGDRVGLFGAVADTLVGDARMLYPGSYVDIAPSVWFDDVTYLDTDRRAAKFFDHPEAVAQLVDTKRQAVGQPVGTAAMSFLHLDYQTELPEPHESFDLLVSLYAGFISEHCTDYLRVGGTLLVNPSHGDAAMASIDPRYELAGVVDSREGNYRVRTDALDDYLIPKNDQAITVDSLHSSGRGIAYTRPAFAYLFTRRH